LYHPAFTQRESRERAARYRGAKVERPEAGGEQARGVPDGQPRLFPKEETQKVGSLPSDNYWTGTVNADNAGNSWNVNDNGGNVNVNNDNQSNDNRVACVP
jgi:hypothetical protein